MLTHLRQAELASSYEQALLAYVESDGAEDRLLSALTLGREAVGEGLGLLDLLSIHHAALQVLIAAWTGDSEARRRLARAEEFLGQAAAPLEMINRGWHEIVGRLRRTNDILEQTVAKRTADLRESEARLDLAQRIAAIGSWDLDPATGACVWSKEMYRLRGLSIGTLAPRIEDLASDVHPDDAAAQQAWLAALMAGESPEP